MSGEISDAVLELMAAKFRMLSDPTRLGILRTLMGGERSVGQVVDQTGQGQANVSKHLKLLLDAGLLSRRKEGLQVFYRICDPMVDELCSLVCRKILQDLEQDLEHKERLIGSLRNHGDRGEAG